MRYKLDTEFNIKEKLRAQLRDRAKTKRYEKALRYVLGSPTSASALVESLGYTVEQLRIHFERQFKRGMTWPAFRAGLIHIDHIIPLSKFDLSQESEIKAAWALTNLRPMWAKLNIERGSRRDLLL